MYGVLPEFTTENFSETPAFDNKSTWSPPLGNRTLKMFSSQMEANAFLLLPDKTTKYSLTKEEWLAMRGIAKDRSTVINGFINDTEITFIDKTDPSVPTRREKILEN